MGPDFGLILIIVTQHVSNKQKVYLKSFLFQFYLLNLMQLFSKSLLFQPQGICFVLKQTALMTDSWGNKGIT
jgi:hypothetical protein